MARLPPAVRILPMSNQEPGFAGKSGIAVQLAFFLRDLPRRGGGYPYRKSGLKAEPGTVVLFQYDRRIVASAELQGVEPYDEPDGDSHGIYYFDVDSIRVFDPVDENLIRKVWKRGFKRFGHIKWSLSPARYPHFTRLLTGIRKP